MRNLHVGPLNNVMCWNKMSFNATHSRIIAESVIQIESQDNHRFEVIFNCCKWPTSLDWRVLRLNWNIGFWSLIDSVCLKAYERASYYECYIFHTCHLLNLWLDCPLVLDNFFISSPAILQLVSTLSIYNLFSTKTVFPVLYFFLVARS